MARAIRLWGVVGGAAALVALAFACLPGLETTPPDAGTVTDSGPKPDRASGAPFCGDGVIDYDAAADGGSGEQCDPGDGDSTGCTKPPNGCRIDCAGGFFDRETNHCYFAVPAGASLYSDARDLCIQHGGHIATIASDLERAKIIDAGLYNSQVVVWVGIAQDPQAGGYTVAEGPTGGIGEPGWSPTCPGCYAFIPDASPAIPKLRPDAGLIDASPTGQAVGDSRKSDTWFQLPQSVGTQKVAVVCEREPVGASAQPCTGGTCIAVPKTLGKKRYLFVPVDQTGDQADQACRALSGGKGRLVVLESREEREQVMKEVARALADSGNGANGVWIGLVRAGPAPTASYVWADGTPVENLPNPWGEKEPNTLVPGVVRAYAGLSDARAFDTQLAHVDDPTHKRPYVCQY